MYETRLKDKQGLCNYCHFQQFVIFLILGLLEDKGADQHRNDIIIKWNKTTTYAKLNITGETSFCLVSVQLIFLHS